MNIYEKLVSQASSINHDTHGFYSENGEKLISCELVLNELRKEFKTNSSCQIDFRQASETAISIQ